MKNLHVLPTDYPSRLRYNIKTRIWELNEFHKYHTDIKSTHNIYITSEEEIKTEDWYYNHKTDTVQKRTKGTNNESYIGFKKVILTTDRDLIKDKVLAIDDAFLKWFVDNPNCKTVGEAYLEIFSPKRNLEKLQFPELVEELAKYYKKVPLVENPVNLSQETLEEACDRIFLHQPGDMSKRVAKEKALDLVKCYQETSYSKEEVKNIINDMVEKHCTYFSQGIKDSVKLEWFERFKK